MQLHSPAPVVRPKRRLRGHAPSPVRCPTRGALFLAVAISIAGMAHADGRIEINQAVVEAAGGFPYVISGPGSHVLTGDLVVGADATAISITAPSGVSVDLNGFRILGTHQCSVGGCSLGTSGGIIAANGTGELSRVFGGTISGFSNNCVTLGDGSHVHEMSVSQCGIDGIASGRRSRIMHNIVTLTGIHGISVGDGSIYGHNTVALVALGNVGGSAFDGGMATAGNVCDDSSCSPDPTLKWAHVLDSSNGDASGCGSDRFKCVLPTATHPEGAAALDLETGLVWDRFPTGTDNGRILAMDSCAKREVGGRKGWHLPMVEQLASLVDPTSTLPALPAGHPFQGIENQLYWTATADAGAAINLIAAAWTIQIGTGAVFNSAQLNDLPLTWCARGGRAFDGNTQR